MVGGVSGGWCRRVEPAAQPAAARVVAGLGRLLDQLQPSQLDPSRQTVETVRDETVIRLAHRSDPAGHLEIVIGTGSAHVYGGLDGHDEAYSVPPAEADAWEQDVIEIVAELLQGRYEVRQSTWRGKPYRTQVTDLGGEAVPRITLLDSVRGILPLPRSALATTSRTVHYGCKGTVPPARARPAPAQKKRYGLALSAAKTNHDVAPVCRLGK